MAFGIHMVNKSEKQPPCTQFEIEMDWESLIRPKDEPKGSFKPALIYRGFLPNATFGTGYLFHYCDLSNAIFGYFFAQKIALMK